MQKAPAPVTKPAPIVQQKTEEKFAEKPPVKSENSKSKPSGKLDWSKAKPKDVKKEIGQAKSGSASAEAHVMKSTAQVTIAPSASS